VGYVTERERWGKIGAYPILPHRSLLKHKNEFI